MFLRGASPITQAKMPEYPLFTTAGCHSLFFLSLHAFVIHLPQPRGNFRSSSRIRQSISCLLYPINNSVVVNSTDSFNCPKSHTIQVHFQAKRLGTIKSSLSQSRMLKIGAGIAYKCTACLPRRWPFLLIWVDAQLGHFILQLCNTRELIEKLLKERLPLAAIARVTGVSKRWLLSLRQPEILPVAQAGRSHPKKPGKLRIQCDVPVVIRG